MDVESLNAIQAEDIAIDSNDPIDKYKLKSEEGLSVNTYSKADSGLAWIENEFAELNQETSNLYFDIKRMGNIARRIIDTRVPDPFLIAYLESSSLNLHKSLSRAQALQLELEKISPFTRRVDTPDEVIRRIQSTSCASLFKSQNVLVSSGEYLKSTIENASLESIGNNENYLVKRIYLEIIDFSKTLDNLHLQMARFGTSESGQPKPGIPIPIPIPLPIPYHPSNPTPTPDSVEICKQGCDAEYQGDVDICVESFPQNPQKRLLCIEAANRRYAQCQKELWKGDRIMTKYEFLWTNAGKEAKGYATISEPKNDKEKWFVEVFCTIDSRMHKIYGADKEHASLMGKGFVVERYCDYSMRNIDGTPFVI